MIGMPAFSPSRLWFPLFLVGVRITALCIPCSIEPTFDSTMVHGGFPAPPKVAVVKVTGPLETLIEVGIATGFKGAEEAPGLTDLVRADSLASDMTYSVFGGLVVVTTDAVEAVVRLDVFSKEGLSPTKDALLASAMEGCKGNLLEDDVLIVGIPRVRWIESGTC